MRDDLGSTQPLVPPIYQSSVYTFRDLDHVDHVYEQQETGYIYARDGHPNATRLAEQLAAVEQAEWAMICATGMGAISAALLATLQQGDRILASTRLYGRTSQLLVQELPRFGVQTSWVDVCDLAQVEAALQQPARLLFVETISNPLLRVVDVEALARLAHQHDCLFVVDNTFATPVLLRPHALSADLVVESLTKIIGGHGDITLGMISGAGLKAGTSEFHTQVAQVISMWGLTANPFDCWLGERGLPTLSLRVRQASQNALQLSHWLATQPGVSAVIYPGCAQHPDHDLARRVLPDGYGHMLCFALEGGREAVNRFMRQAPGIPFSPSLGYTRTTCSHPGTTSHRHASPAEKRRQGIHEGLIRLSVGVEDLAEIQKEMARGLRQ